MCMRHPCMRPKMNVNESDELAVPLCYRCHPSEARQLGANTPEKAVQKASETANAPSEKTKAPSEKTNTYSEKTHYSEKGLPEPVTHSRRDTRTPRRVLAFVAIGTCVAWQTYNTVCK